MIGKTDIPKKKKKPVTKKKGKSTSKAKAKVESNEPAGEVVKPTLQDLVRKINKEKYPELQKVENSALKALYTEKPKIQFTAKLDKIQPVKITKAAAEYDSKTDEEKKKTSLVFPKIVIKVKKAAEIAKDVAKAVQAVKQSGQAVTLPAVNKQLSTNYQSEGYGGGSSSGDQNNTMLIVGAGLLGFVAFKNLK